MKLTIKVEGLSYRYPQTNRMVLDSAECTIKTGEIVNLIGLAESGKSTFCRLMKGFEEPTGGRFALLSGDGNVRTVRGQERLNLMGWTPPLPETAFFAETVYDEIAFGLQNQGVEQAEQRQKVERVINLLALAPELLSRYPQTLSGGEKRRVALASIAVMDYQFYIFDEPTAGLDYNGVRAFEQLISQLQTEGKGVIRVGHDLDNMKRAGGRFLLLEQGKLWETVKVEQYLERYGAV